MIGPGSRADVWHASLSATTEPALSSYRALLSAEERRRADAFARGADR
jgi:hypothetical protein